MNKFIGEQVVSALRENSFDKEAEELERLLCDVVSEDKNLRRVAANEIIGCCQIQAYGNLNMRNINGWKWNSMLDKLKKYAMKAL